MSEANAVAFLDFLRRTIDRELEGQPAKIDASAVFAYPVLMRNWCLLVKVHDKKPDRTWHGLVYLQIIRRNGVMELCFSVVPPGFAQGDIMHRIHNEPDRYVFEA